MDSDDNTGSADYWASNILWDETFTSSGIDPVCESLLKFFSRE